MVEHIPEILVTAFHALIVGGGILSIVLGYRLFSSLPTPAGRGLGTAVGNSGGKFKIENFGEITLSRVGPGVFFALFGAFVLAYSAIHPVKLSSAENRAYGFTGVRNVQTDLGNLRKHLAALDVRDTAALMPDLIALQRDLALTASGSVEENLHYDEQAVRYDHQSVVHDAPPPPDPLPNPK